MPGRNGIRFDGDPVVLVEQLIVMLALTIEEAIALKVINIL